MNNFSLYIYIIIHFYFSKKYKLFEDKKKKKVQFLPTYRNCNIARSHFHLCCAIFFSTLLIPLVLYTYILIIFRISSEPCNSYGRISDIEEYSQEKKRIQFLEVWIIGSFSNVMSWRNQQYVLCSKWRIWKNSRIWYIFM